MVKNLSIASVLEDDLFIDRLPLAAKKAFRFFVNDKILCDTSWYLAGGTALTLQLGHRKSVDLDFFCQDTTFDEVAWERKLMRTGVWQTTRREEGTIFGTFLEAKVSFIAYPFFLPSRVRLQCGHLRLLTAPDIAVMKIIAISQRGRKRDFLDLYWYARHREPIEDVLRRTIVQYPGQDKNVNHLLASLIYFHDADEDPLPRMYVAVSWVQVKRYFEREIPRIAKKFFGL